MWTHNDAVESTNTSHVSASSFFCENNCNNKNVSGTENYKGLKSFLHWLLTSPPTQNNKQTHKKGGVLGGGGAKKEQNHPEAKRVKIMRHVKWEYSSDEERQQIPYPFQGFSSFLHNWKANPTPRDLAQFDTCCLTLAEPPLRGLPIFRHQHLHSSPHPPKQAASDRLMCQWPSPSSDRTFVYLHVPCYTSPFLLRNSSHFFVSHLLYFFLFLFLAAIPFISKPCPFFYSFSRSPPQLPVLQAFPLFSLFFFLSSLTLAT